MALEQIFAKIKEDAGNEAKAILEMASKEADSIIRSAEEEAAHQKERTVAEASAELEFALHKEVISKKLSIQKEVLRIKKAEIDKCFEDALNILFALNDIRYRELIKNMLSEIHVAEDAEIIFSARDQSRITADFIRSIKPNLKMSFSDSIKGGFILKTSELIMDNSLDNLLGNIRETLEPSVAGILFKEA